MGCERLTCLQLNIVDHARLTVCQAPTLSGDHVFTPTHRSATRAAARKQNMINIVMRHHAGQVGFRVQRSTIVQKLIQSFAAKTGKPANALRVCNDWGRVNTQDTVESVSYHHHEIESTYCQQ